MRKPHTQIGQKGKGKGKAKPKRGGKPRYTPQPVPPMETPGLPLEVGQFPKAPPQVPNFLPNTAQFERTQGDINDAMSAAGAQYGISTGLVGPQMNLARQRLQTDMGVAQSRLDESLAERGFYTGGVRPQMYEREITTPFGRAFQDLALGGAKAYAQAGSDYGNALLGGAKGMMNAYNDRANDAYELAPLSVPTGGYQLPHLPGPQLTTQMPAGGGGGGGGKTRPKQRGRNRPRGRR